jgi:hypothetical protein
MPEIILLLCIAPYFVVGGNWQLLQLWLIVKVECCFLPIRVQFNIFIQQVGKGRKVEGNNKDVILMGI